MSTPCLQLLSPLLHSCAAATYNPQVFVFLTVVTERDPTASKSVTLLVSRISVPLNLYLIHTIIQGVVISFSFHPRMMEIMVLYDEFIGSM